MAAPLASTVNPDDVEELRLAVVMNGGVSLAVWIGGVASEINRLVRGAGIYGELLAATHTDARVDVISGTSAGGINGALLALASACDADLGPLRELWLDSGAFEALLRSPMESDPPSLLRGNDYFLAELRRAFAKLRDSGRGLTAPAAVPIELTLTTTLLNGNPNTVPDDFGTVIADVNHRAAFCFRRGPDLANDAFADPRIAERLAYAGRATASFPVAFEPLYYPADAPDQAGAPLGPESRNLPQSRFLVDGGILDNKPLESAIDAVFAQRATRDVRRVLAYVVPNPGATAQPAADKADALPGLAQVALASLVELPRVESISAQIEAVRRHNLQVRRKHQNRAGVMTLGLATLEMLAESLFPVYRQRRLESSADYLFPAISDGLIALTKGRQALGRRMRDWMITRFLVLGDEVPWTPRLDPLHPGAGAERKGWRWGVFALENMAELMLDVLQRTLRLTSPGRAQERVRTKLMTLRIRAYDRLSEVRKRRVNDGAFWRRQSEALVALLAGKPTGSLEGGQVRDWIAAALEAWKAEFVDRSAGAPLESLALAIAQIIAEAAGIFRTHFPDADAWQRAEDRAAHAALRQHFDVLVPEGGTLDDVLRNLLVVEVVLNAFGSYRDVKDQYVELAQVSADAPTSFGGPDTAGEKLAGAQLANFGAFLKRSWRANDWMFGRLDGAARLALIVLNPDRLRRLHSAYAGTTRHGGAATAREAIYHCAVAGVGNAADRAFLEGHWRNDAARIDAELAYLDNADLPIPEQLPACAAAVTRRLHLDILRAELPVLAAAAEHDIERGGNPRGFGAAFALAMAQATRAAHGARIPPESVVSLFAACHIGRERIDEEIGSDLVTSIASRAVAVSVAAAAGKHSSLGPVRGLFQTGRVAAIAFDLFAQGLVTGSRTMVAVFTAGLTLGTALLLLGVAYADQMPGVLRSAGAVLVVATLGVAFLRYHVLAAAATVAGGILMLVAMGPDWLSHTGLEEDGISWLRVAAVGLFFVLVCALALFVSRGPRKRFTRK